MRVIPTVSRLALSVVLAFGICAAPYSLALQSGRVEPVKQEAHAAAPLVAIPAIAAACGISEEAAIAGIGAIVAGVAGVSLFDIAQSRDVTVGDIAEDYVNRQAEMGYFDERALYEPPDPNNQNGNDPEGRSNKLKSVLIALATTTGASVAFSALDNLVDSVFDWATAATSDSGAGSLEIPTYATAPGTDITLKVSSIPFYDVPVRSQSNSNNRPYYPSVSSAFVETNTYPIYADYKSDGANIFACSYPHYTAHINGSSLSLEFSSPDGFVYSDLHHDRNHPGNYFFYGGLKEATSFTVWPTKSWEFFILPDGFVKYSDSPIANAVTQLPEIIDDTVKQYGFATSTESQQTIVNNYINNYVNQPATGDRVTVITIPTVDPGQATYPDYKTEVEPEKVTPVTPKPDTPVKPDTPDEPMDFKTRVEKLLNLGFGAIFPFCLIDDLAMLFNKLVAAPAVADVGTDFSQFTIPLSKFGVAGADDLTFDLSPLVDLAQQFRWAWVWLELAGLLALSFKLFLNRGGE